MLRQFGGIFAFLSQCSSLELNMFQVLVCAHTRCGLHLICSILRRLLCNGLTARLQGQKWPHTETQNTFCFSPWSCWKEHTFQHLEWPRPEPRTVLGRRRRPYPDLSCYDEPFKSQSIVCDLRCFYSKPSIHLWWHPRHPRRGPRPTLIQLQGRETKNSPSII